MCITQCNVSSFDVYVCVPENVMCVFNVCVKFYLVFTCVCVSHTCVSGFNVGVSHIFLCVFHVGVSHTVVFMWAWQTLSLCSFHVGA